MRKISYLMIGLLAGTFAGCASRDAYVVVEEGSGSFRSAFSKKMSTSEDQWTYAQLTLESGAERRAERAMLYLVRRWPNSLEAPLAARGRADILFERGHLEKAFDAYQFLIDNYAARMENYDDVLDYQFSIAKQIMERRRLRWMFGGFATPEDSIKYFEMLIRSGPQSAHAAEAQYLIGKSYQGNDEYELAIASYQILVYRYPESRFAEEGFWQQLQCLLALREEFPRSPELRERLLTASNVFYAMFPDSTYIDQVRDIRNDLYQSLAEVDYTIGDFYGRISKRPESALIYYEALKKEYSLSRRVLPPEDSSEENPISDVDQRIAEMKALIGPELDEE